MSKPAFDEEVDQQMQDLLRKAALDLRGGCGVLQAFIQMLREDHPYVYAGMVRGLAEERRREKEGNHAGCT